MKQLNLLWSSTRASVERDDLTLVIIVSDAKIRVKCEDKAGALALALHVNRGPL